MRAPERIETQRLILRRPLASDAGAIFERYANDAEVTRLLAWPRHRTMADTHGFLMFSDNAWGKSPGGPYVIEDRATGELLGGTGFDFETAAHATVGYALARDAWGKGCATEALLALVDMAKALGVSRLAACCHVDNAASINVLEKCGFVLDRKSACRAFFPNLDGGVEAGKFDCVLVLRGDEVRE